MRAINEFESGSKAAVRRDVLICLKCGSDKVMREQENMTCEECGAVLFFVNLPKHLYVKLDPQYVWERIQSPTSLNPPKV